MDTTLERTPVAMGTNERAQGMRAFVAVVLAVAGIGAAGLGLAMTDRIGSGDVVRLLLLGIWGIAGLSLAMRRPAEPMGFVVLAAVVAGGVGSVGASAGGTWGALVRWLALGLVSGFGMQIVTGLPDGRLVKRAHRTWLWIFYAGGIVLALASWIARPSPVWPVAVYAAVVALAAASISSTRYRKARGLARQRMQWFGWAVTVGAVLAVVSGALRLLLDWPDDPAVVVAVATIAIPIALAFGASAYTARIDRLLEFTISIAGLVGLVAVIYLLVVLGFGEIPEPGDERQLLALAMVAAAVTALLYMPTRARLQDVAARVVYGERHAPDEVLRTFGSRMTRAVPMDELLLQAAESLRKTFALDAVEVWTGQAGSFERTVSDPERGHARMTIGAKELPVMARAGVTGPAWMRIWLPTLLEGREDSMLRLAPVSHQGEVLGFVIVERFSAADVFGEEEERVLTELARTIGIALHNVQLDSALQQTLDEVRRQAEDLRASRERIVKSADAARRKLERDLHDGAQQHVVALAVKAKLIKNLLDTSPDTSKQMLDELSGDIQGAVQQLRDLAHGIFPPLLVDRGLEAALSSVADRAAIPTEVRAENLNRYKPEIETAVYFCAMEALQNAGKHAGEGSSAVITLREEEGALLFSVADDGAGFDAAGKGLGAGFVNMQDRVGAVGGTLKVDSAPGKGTKVYARVPLV